MVDKDRKSREKEYAAPEALYDIDGDDTFDTLHPANTKKGRNSTVERRVARHCSWERKGGKRRTRRRKWRWRSWPMPVSV